MLNISGLEYIKTVFNMSWYFLILELIYQYILIMISYEFKKKPNKQIALYCLFLIGTV